MPFDPTLPIELTPADAAQMRAQFNGLKALIDAVPAGPPGPQGPPFASAVVDSTSTLQPGENATATASFDGTSVHLSFGIPRGADGVPVTSFIVDGVNTLNPGERATAQASFDGSAIRFVFGIPRGMDGSQGPQGGPGAPGEVTNNDLAGAIAGTSTNTNAVATLDTAFSDPPTLADLEAVRGKLNELILALRR